MAAPTTHRRTWAVDHFLLGLLADGPIRAADAVAQAEAAGFSQSSLSLSRRRLGVLSRRVGFGPGSYVVWESPPAD